MSNKGDLPSTAKPAESHSSEDRGPMSPVASVILFLAVCALGLGLFYFQRTTQALRLPARAAMAPPSPDLAYNKLVIDDGKSAVRTANVQVLDFDGDGLMDILVCDTARNSVTLYRQTAGGKFEPQILAENLKCPAHATVVDLNHNGKLDVVVAVLGSISPSDELVGKVVLLDNDGAGHFTQQVLLDDVRRVADVQVGDFDGDGKMDIAVAVFGYARGEVLWLQNMGKKDGKWHFRDHQLLDRPGVIHVPVADYDGDGKPDIAAVVSQDEEEMWTFQNLGGGHFKAQRQYASPNYDVGSAGLVLCDLDQDGKPDLLLPQGDNLEDAYAWPMPYHGCLWFRNLGNFKFEKHQIAHFGGTYAAAVGDLNGDGHPDVVLSSLCNDWSDPTRPSLVWLENDGKQNFTMHPIATSPIGLITVACGDLNKDGKADIVAGSLMLPPVAEKRVQSVTVWMSKPATPSK